MLNIGRDSPFQSAGLRHETVSKELRDQISPRHVPHIFGKPGKYKTGATAGLQPSHIKLSGFTGYSMLQ